MSDTRMTGELSAASTEAIEALGHQLDVLEADGGRYATAYICHILTGATRPVTPAGMHLLIAKAVRDVAADAALAVRLYGKRRAA